MFVTVRPNIVEAEWVAEEEKDEKKKNQKKKTSAETIRHLVLWTGCLISMHFRDVLGVAGHFVTRSFRHNVRSFRHSQFVTPELSNQRRFWCPALYYYHDYTIDQSSKQ